MVKDRNKLKRDLTLAYDIFEKIHNSDLRSTLLSFYPNETLLFFEKLKELDETYNANHVHSITLLLDDFSKNCDYFEKLPDSQKDQVVVLMQTQQEELKQLDGNISKLHISIKCALDGFTLNRTTFLITFLQNIIDQDLKNDIKENLLPPREAGSTKQASFGRTDETHAKLIEKELDIAKGLKTLCEQIRAQIGSPETMPKGLVIDFMVHLLDAIRSCQEANDQPETSERELLNCINNEINQIKICHPELAKAAEELQKAIANY